MTAIVILNVIGAVLIVTAIVSGLAWAVILDGGGRPGVRLVRTRSAAARPRSQRQRARAALDLQ